MRYRLIYIVVLAIFILGLMPLVAGWNLQAPVWWRILDGVAIIYMMALVAIGLRKKP